MFAITITRSLDLLSSPTPTYALSCRQIGDLSSHFKPDGPADKKSKKMQDERDTRVAQQTADNKAKGDNLALIYF